MKIQKKFNPQWERGQNAPPRRTGPRRYCTVVEG